MTELQTARLLLRPWFESDAAALFKYASDPENPASGRVMEKCGFVHTNKETVCPKLEVGGDKPVRVMTLSREDWLKETAKLF